MNVILSCSQWRFEWHSNFSKYVRVWGGSGIKANKARQFCKSILCLVQTNLLIRHLFLYYIYSWVSLISELCAMNFILFQDAVHKAHQLKPEEGKDEGRPQGPRWSHEPRDQVSIEHGAAKLDRGSIRSSPSHGSSPPYKMTAFAPSFTADHDLKGD